MTEPDTIREILDIIAAKAPALRKAGVLELSTPGGWRLQLAPDEIEIPREVVNDDMGIEDERPTNPLDDPETFGRKTVPRRRTTENWDEDEE